jgi:hypothetical protein
MMRGRSVLDVLRTTRWIHYLMALVFLVGVETVGIGNIFSASLATGGLARMLTRLSPYTTVDTVPGTSIEWVAPDLVAAMPTACILVLLGLGAVLLGRSRWVRYLLLGYLGIVGLELVTSVVLIFLSLWNPEGHSILYLNDAATVWVLNIVLFGLLYWGLDAECQVARFGGRVRTHFRFPQDELRGGAWDGWTPGIVDYLFLAFSTSTALSPTDTDCLTRRAKVLMMFQSVVSLSVIIMVVARAVNII